MTIFAFAVALLVLGPPLLATAQTGSPDPNAAAPPAPRISTDAKDGQAGTQGYAHPAAMVGRPLLPETPLMAEARTREPKDLWDEMGVIENEMKLYAGDGRYDMLPHLAERWVADMNAAFMKVYAGAITPRQVGMKRALLTCASVSNQVSGAVDQGEAYPIERAVEMVEGCNQLFARFLPPEVTGLPDEFAGYQDPPGIVPTEIKPPQPDQPTPPPQ
jgi:hypothetical protein